MIVSFYDKNFKGLQNNASLVVDKSTYSLIKRPVEIDELKCNCEAYTENIQPTFLVVKDDVGNYIYGALAGVPLLNEKNITEISSTDLKTLLSSDVILEPSSYSYVYQYLNYIFAQWQSQVNQNSFSTELIYKTYTNTIQSIAMGDLFPSIEKQVYNAWDEMQAYLKFYGLFLETELDLINKKVKFIVGKTMVNPMNIKLWEYGIRNYGKWVASINECQGYYNNGSSWTAGYKWILTSQNDITVTTSNRDIYPIKRKVFVSEESLQDANTQALTELLANLYNENIEIQTTDITPDFETSFAVYVNKGDGKYKDLPCGELIYDSSGLNKCQIGYRFTGANFI